MMGLRLYICESQSNCLLPASLKHQISRAKVDDAATASGTSAGWFKIAQTGLVATTGG